MINLQPGERKKIRVDARQKYNSSHVKLHKGATYYFTCDRQQKWFDASIDATVEGWTVEQAIKTKKMGRIQGTLISWTDRFRRVPNANWLELVAAIGNTDDELFRVLEFPDKSHPYKPNHDGEFCPFANDLTFKYGNNRGFVDVVIYRI